ncbi:hypothetical protein OAQ15_02810 [Flavobacteriaceae bacterium]|nr:hypothetical protein [Flavobacteriaceae bacterium]
MFKKYFFLFFIILSSIHCSSDTSLCGEIIDKQEINGKYYFIFNANSGIYNTNSISNNSYIPDDSVSGEVSSADYNKFSIGEEYCSE